MTSSLLPRLAMAACVMLAVGDASATGPELRSKVTCRTDPVVWPVTKSNSRIQNVTNDNSYQNLNNKLLSLVSVQVSGLFASRRHFCSGTIISHEWVLTSASCIKAVPWLASVSVVAGKLDLESEDGEQRAAVSKMYAHENYDPKRNGGVGPNDIGLLRLKTPIVYTSTVTSASLPTLSEIFNYGTVGGWGVNVDGQESDTSRFRHYARIPVLTQNACKDFFKQQVEWGHPNLLDDTNMCVGDLKNLNKGAQVSDAGGPLISDSTPTTGGGFIVHGVASWGYFPCQAEPSPFVFTRVLDHVAWIKNTIRNSTASV